MEILIYLLGGIIVGFISYAFWCYFYTQSGKASSFYSYMDKNDGYDWIFFSFMLWPIALLLLVFIGICLLVFTITGLIRHMFKIDE